MNNRAQTFVEYTLLIGVSIAILLALTPMIKRGTQAMVKVVSDGLGVQQNAEQKDNGAGGLIKSDVTTAFNRSELKTDRVASGTHSRKTSVNDQTVTGTQTTSDLGFTQKD